MKSIKKAASIFTAAAAALMSLTGCGTGGSSEVIKIGAIGPVTGAAAIYGQAVKNGAEIAIEEVNAKEN